MSRIVAPSLESGWGDNGGARFPINLSLEKKTSGNFGELVGLYWETGGNGLNLTSKTPNPLPSFSAPRGNVYGKNKLIGQAHPSSHISITYVFYYTSAAFLPNSLQELLTLMIDGVE